LPLLRSFVARCHQASKRPLAWRHLPSHGLPGPAKIRRAYAEQNAPLLLFFRLLICRQPATHPRHRSPASAPGCPPPQQKQRRFVHLAFPGWTAAIAPTVATRSSRIRALKFGLSERVDRSILGRRKKASRLDRFPGLASRSAPGLSRGLLPCTSHNGRYVLAALRASAWLIASPAPVRPRHARPAQ